MPRKDVHEAIDAQVLVEPLANELGIVVGIAIQKCICIHVVRNKDQQHDGEDVVSLVLKDLKALLEDVAVEVLVKKSPVMCPKTVLTNMYVWKAIPKK